jgi:hypothetical protein
MGEPWKLDSRGNVLIWKVSRIASTTSEKSGLMPPSDGVPVPNATSVSVEVGVSTTVLEAVDSPATGTVFVMVDTCGPACDPVTFVIRVLVTL